MLNADNLRIVRKFYRLHQAQLAEIVNVGQSYIALVENGSRPLTQSLNKRIMAALELTPAKVEAILALDSEYKQMQAKLNV